MASTVLTTPSTDSAACRRLTSGTEKRFAAQSKCDTLK